VNHDGRVFDNPESFDVRRRANKHMGFGYGPHQCLGLHIARLEARHAFHGILYQTGEFELAGEVQWRNAHLRGLTALPVRRR
jgi:cytochrome P450